MSLGVRCTTRSRPCEVEEYARDVVGEMEMSKAVEDRRWERR